MRQCEGDVAGCCVLLLAGGATIHRCDMREECTLIHFLSDFSLRRVFYEDVSRILYFEM